MFPQSLQLGVKEDAHSYFLSRYMTILHKFSTQKRCFLFCSGIISTTKDYTHVCWSPSVAVVVGVALTLNYLTTTVTLTLQIVCRAAAIETSGPDSSMPSLVRMEETPSFLLVTLTCSMNWTLTLSS